MLKFIFKSLPAACFLYGAALSASSMGYNYLIARQGDNVEKSKFIRIGKSNVKISSEKAKRIALSHAGFTEKEAKMTKIELGVENGVPVYEIEFYVNNRKFEYDINTNTGEIVDFRR